MKFKKHIPNFITCLNLLCGCLAIVFVFKNELVTVAYFVFAASVIDFLDGMAARLLNAHSEIGKQLDSLADMVTFGVVPGFIIFKLMGRVDLHEITDNYFLLTFFKIIPFLIPIFSALRLAKFNIDIQQKNSFIGLPTPANTIFISSLPLILANDKFGLTNFILHTYFLVSITIIMSYLLIAKINLFSLKIKNVSFSENKIQFIFILLSAILLASFLYSAIPIIIILYVILSLINNSLRKELKSV